MGLKTVVLYNTCKGPLVFLANLIEKRFWNIDTLGIRLPVDFVILYQIMQSTSSTKSYSEGFTLIARILHKIVSNTV